MFILIFMYMDNIENMGGRIAVFNGAEIRKVFRDGEWWFSVVDVCGALTDSLDAKDYWYRMKVRVNSEDGI